MDGYSRDPYGQPAPQQPPASAFGSVNWLSGSHAWKRTLSPELRSHIALPDPDASLPREHQQHEQLDYSSYGLQPLPTPPLFPPMDHLGAQGLPLLPELPTLHEPSANSLSYQQAQIAEERLWQEATASMDDLYNGAAPFLDFNSTAQLHYQPPSYPLFQYHTPSSSVLSSATSSPYPQYTHQPPRHGPSISSAFDLNANPQLLDLSAITTTFGLPLPQPAPQYPPQSQVIRLESTSLISAQSSPSSSSSPPPPQPLALPSLYPLHVPPSRPSSTASQPSSSLLHTQPSPLASTSFARASTAPVENDEVIATASARRAQHEAQEPPLAGQAREGLKPAAMKAAKPKKGVLEAHATCWTCGDSIARLVLRGKELDNVSAGAKSSSACVKCLPVDEVRLKEEEKDTKAGSNDSATYRDTLSAAVDRLEGLALGENEPDGPEVVLPDDMKKDAFTCDVCLRIVGVGSVSAGHAKFTVEVICTRCDKMYKPCSDCGGGGGRLTPGRWRCKELFPAGRRTCILSHARNPTLDELSFEVLTIDEIPTESLDALEARCRQLYFGTRLSTICRPEFLSRGDGLATTYQQAYRTTVDGWNAVAPHFRQNIEETRGIRRYVALMYSVPHSRRSKQSKEEAQRSDRVVTGFFLVELDLAHGAAFFSVIAPWNTTGAAFDSNTKLGEHSVLRMLADISRLNEERAAQGLSLYPRVMYNWVIAPFRIDSRMSQSLQRRGYMPFEQFVEAYPEAPREAFPPHREIFIPAAYVKAWQIHVLYVREGDDLGAPPPKAPRRRAPKSKT